jgi:hypothetical protein
VKKHHILYMVGGYLVVAYAYNRFVAQPGSFMLPFDLLGNVI